MAADAGTETFRFRAAFLLLAFILWAIAAGASLISYTWFKAPSLRQDSERIGRREGVFPAARGRILDADGIPLAWTEMRLDLYLDAPPKSSKQCRKMLAEYHCGLPEKESDYPVLVEADMKPDEPSVLRCCHWMELIPELRLRTRYERFRVDYPQLADVIGSCAENADGVPIGKSGFEERFEEVLGGTPGTFRVMLDRKGKWIPGTLEITRSPEEGHDVRLELNLKSLLQRNPRRE